MSHYQHLVDFIVCTEPHKPFSSAVSKCEKWRNWVCAGCLSTLYRCRKLSEVDPRGVKHKVVSPRRMKDKTGSGVINRMSNITSQTGFSVFVCVCVFVWSPRSVIFENNWMCRGYCGLGMKVIAKIFYFSPRGKLKLNKLHWKLQMSSYRSVL